MKLNVLKIISAALLLSLLAGCSAKEETVTYETKKDTKKEIVNEQVDDKLSQIKSNENDVVENDMSKIDENSYMNKVVSDINGKSVNITSIHFGFDNYLMRDEMITITAENAQKLSEVMNENPNVKVKIEGNCDEWGSDEYNFALGLKRTKTVKDELINNGLKASSIIVVSLGEGNPLCSDHTAKCWKKNRRVDHRLIK